MSLTEEQKRNLYALAAVGCGREQAVLLVRGTWNDLQRELASDKSFAIELARSEARAELVHIRNLQEAARDPKNWRCSTWCLERMSPERYGLRRPRSIRLAEFEQFVEELTRRMGELASSDEVRQELLDCLRAGTDILQQAFELQEAGPDA